MIVSSQILNISKDGYFTASPGNLLQCLTIITVKKRFLVFRWNCMYFDLCLLRLGCHWALSIKICLCLQSSIRYLYALIMSPLKLIFSQLASLSSVSLSSYEKCSSPIIELHGLLLKLPAIFSLFLVLGRWELDPAVQMWPHHCWVEGKNHISWSAFSTPNAAQVTLFLITLRVHCWRTLNLLSYRTPTSFSAEQLPSLLACRFPASLGPFEW